MQHCKNIEKGSKTSFHLLQDSHFSGSNNSNSCRKFYHTISVYGELFRNEIYSEWHQLSSVVILDQFKNYIDHAAMVLANFLDYFLCKMATLSRAVYK